MTSTATTPATTSTPQKHRPFPILVAESHSPKPDNHPYAIRSTASGLLTRSNSTTNRGSHAHTYIPASPSPNSKHRYTKSEISANAKRSSVLAESPRPLPIPPSMEFPSKEGPASADGVRPLLTRTKRADTLPSVPPLSSPVKMDDLPSNPKIWSTSQLASYLITALRVKSSDSIPVPAPIARDIALFIKEARLTGRAFIKLTEEDLDVMGVNTLWREALLNASRNLRQNVVKGRIWGFDAGEEQESYSSRGRRLPFFRKEYNSSSSSVDLSDSPDITPSKGRGHGRVRSMISSLERSESHGSHSSDGLGLYNAPWVDEDPLTSGSDASEADNEGSDCSPPSAPRSLPIPPATPPIDSLEEIPGDAVEVVVLEERVCEGELTVQALLKKEDLEGSWGAKAWEDIDLKSGVTVKRLVEADDTPSKGRGTPQSTSRTGSARKKLESPQIKDIFSRPLPQPPVSDVESPVVQSSKADQGVQRSKDELELELEAAMRLDVGVQTDESNEKEELLLERQRSFELIEQLKARLSETEQKLQLSEAHNSDVAASLVIERRSCAVETEEPMASTLGQVEDSACDVVEGPAESSSSFTVSEGLQQVVGIANNWRDMLPKKDWDPLEKGLSSYVLMVGVGVCAVVLQTLLKRLAGKR